MDNGAGERHNEAEVTEALAMLHAFQSVGVQSFDVTLTDLAGQKISYQSNRSIGELRHRVATRLEAASRLQTNFIIRPRSTTATLIQLDDLSSEKAERLAPHAFMIIRTSPGSNGSGNFQAWIAVKDSTPDFPLRLKRGAGSDPTASGATRIAGSINFKSKYAPAFPVVTITHANAANVTTAAALESAGFVARAEKPPSPPASVPPRVSPPQPAVARRWPDYQQSLRGAPLKPDGSGPDRSKADFMFCKWAAERGWAAEEVAAKLAELSEKAQERIRLKDEGYPLLTARNAAAAVERERGRRQQPVKSTLRPR